MVCSGGDVSTYQKEISDDSDQPSSSLPRLRQHTHRQERAQPQREPTVPVPHLRGEQGAASQVTLSEERKAEVLRAYQERSSLRGLSRTFGITRKTITQWLKKNS
jgi:hypothetical protein